jgi:hypothetical protein
LNVYHCRSYIINEKSEKILLTRSWPEYESVYDNIWHRINWHRNQYISDFVYNRDALVKQGGFYRLPLAWSSDDISAYIAMQDKGIAHTNIPIFNYRKSNLTITSSGNFELKMKAILLEEEWFSLFLKEKLPQKDINKILYTAIAEKKEKYFLKKKLYVIISSMRAKGITSVFFWLKESKKYKIKKILLCYSLIEFLKMKYT